MDSIMTVACRVLLLCTHVFIFAIWPKWPLFVFGAHARNKKNSILGRNMHHKQFSSHFSKKKKTAMHAPPYGQYPKNSTLAPVAV